MWWQKEKRMICDYCTLSKETRFGGRNCLRCLDSGTWTGSESGVGPIQGGALWEGEDVLFSTARKTLDAQHSRIKSQMTQLHLHNHVNNIALDKSN